jgi:hypothetical protein
MVVARPWLLPLVREISGMPITIRAGDPIDNKLKPAIPGSRPPVTVFQRFETRSEIIPTTGDEIIEMIVLSPRPTPVSVATPTNVPAILTEPPNLSATYKPKVERNMPGMTKRFSPYSAAIGANSFL